ncbi:Nif3-like dinuclear metal center hexameric protein [Apilactobacillus timberlakei]|uniref:Nif3-like dinuclear metal center hexameric protein n=1 Tax=Apilactobacillus timberlakei TaxID=2008380 RepID=UPI001127799E|nr:Nif3-like dinuclear metal center hexameric protein [Apilactobacillus timberlakei]TPR20073.1 Nif3-like dinuclear metal center hexameric protein [Apilactobacillus timberlakei]TPR21791.1 Nif3-like dinuclear metal center hexameric protein [Apilactobacillus timberlakei]TPR23037.1 Nif3-like dinuclear metal center hexameric protein [Apilactobacillus timberlakei]
MKVIELVRQFEKFAPKKIAVDGDPIGLQIGSLNQDVHKIMTTLDVRPEVVDEAINNHVDFIFSHHPLMFRPAKNLDLSNPQNSMYAKIIEHHITVYSAHTNLDNAVGGMNDWLADSLQLKDTKGLVYQTKMNNHEYFMGRIGMLSNTMTVYEFAEFCKKQFNISGLRLISNTPDKLVNKVAILGGDGGKFFNIAKNKGADVYVTGDVYYHVGHDMLASDFSVVDPGHHIESICKPYLAVMFRKWAKQLNWNVEVIESDINTDPFTFI